MITAPLDIVIAIQFDYSASSFTAYLKLKIPDSIVATAHPSLKLSAVFATFAVSPAPTFRDQRPLNI
ncbi:MAG: hypothetical protein EPO60_02655, partial [Rugosibacter sp.]